MKYSLARPKSYGRRPQFHLNMSLKHFHLLAIVVALAGGVVLAACRTPNYNGTWQGQRSEGKVISFPITNNALTRAKLECKLQCQLSGFCPTESSFEGDVTATLDGNSFSGSIQSATFNG